MAAKNLLRVALFACDARRTLVRLLVAANIAAARDGFSGTIQPGFFINSRCAGFRLLHRM